MLSNKPWKIEAVFWLMLALGFALIFGSFIWQQVQLLLGVESGGQGFFDYMAVNLLFYVFIFILMYFFLKYHSATWGEFFGVGTAELGKKLGFTLGIALAVTPVALGLNYLCTELITRMDGTAETQAAVKMFQDSGTTLRRMGFAFTAIIAAPLVEEVLFRGVFYPLIKQAGYPRIAVWGSSLLFAAIHVNLATFLPLTLLAVVFVWLYERTQTLLAPIIAHALFNGVNFTLMIYESEITELFRRNVE